MIAAIAPLLDELEAAAAHRARVYMKVPTTQGVAEFREQIILADERAAAARRAVEELVASEQHYCG